MLGFAVENFQSKSGLTSDFVDLQILTVEISGLGVAFGGRIERV